LLGLAGGGLVAMFWAGLAAITGIASAVGANAAKRLGVAMTVAILLAALALYHAKFGASAFSEAGLPVSLAGLLLCAAGFGLLVQEKRRSRRVSRSSHGGLAVPAE